MPTFSSADSRSLRWQESYRSLGRFPTDETREELTGLMVAHRAVYDTRSAKASSALFDRHQRALWPTLDSLKLRAGLAGCRDRNEHREPHAGPAPFTVTDDYLRHGGGCVGE